MLGLTKAPTPSEGLGIGIDPAAQGGDITVTQEVIDHVVTQEDLDNNPDLAEQGVGIGDTIKIPAPQELTDEEKSALLEEENKKNEGQNDQNSAAPTNVQTSNGGISPEDNGQNSARPAEETKTEEETSPNDQENQAEPEDSLEKAIKAAKYNDHPFEVVYANGYQYFIINVSDSRLRNFLTTCGRLAEEFTPFEQELAEDQALVVIK